jgi:hypothetical protein
MRFLAAIAVVVLWQIHAVAQVFPDTWGNHERRDAVRPGQIYVCFSADAVSVQSPYAIAARYGLTLRAPLLRYEQSLQAKHVDAVRVAVAPHANVVALENALLRTWVAEFDESRGAAEFVARKLMYPCGEIELAEPIPLPMPAGELPNDSLATQQQLLTTIRIVDAWKVEPGDSTIRIGISDTGVRTDHEDLVDMIWTNRAEIPDNGIDDDQNGYVDDYRGYSFTANDDKTKPGDPYNPVNGHGTGVAGICGATTNNGIGIAGVAGNARLVPLKTTPNNSGGIVYGYESIMFCAVTGVDVVNCSWGGFTYTCTNERIVQYAIARGTAVVAAAGNHGTTAAFFPAAYQGVLSVGVTNPADAVVPMSARGAFVDVMAPGNESTTTSNDGTYGSFCCTSGSAPIVAGVVGLIRARHRFLTPVQACALATVAVEDISERNPDVAALVPGRIDALKAVTLSPDSIPALDLRTDTVLHRVKQRWGVGDTIGVWLTLTNHLAMLRDARITIDAVGPSADAIEVLDTEINVGDVASNSAVAIGSISQRVPGLHVRVLREVSNAVVLRLRIVGRTEQGDVHQQTLRSTIVPVPSWSTFERGDLFVSVGDNARIGVVDHGRGLGEGVRYRSECGILYEGSLMVGVVGRAVDNARAHRGYHDHFVAVKTLRDSDPHVGIVADSAAPDSLRIGVAVRQTISIEGGAAPVFTTDLTLVNTSSNALVDPVLLYYFDWDLGEQASANRVDRIEASSGMAGSALAVVRAIDKASGTPDVVVAATPLSPFTRAVVVGYDNTLTYDGFSTQKKQDLLQGALEHYGDVNDVAVLAGAKFDGIFMPGDRRSVRLAFSMHPSGDTALRAVQAIEEDRRRAGVLRRPFPNPARESIVVPVDVTGSNVAITVWDGSGRMLVRHSLGAVDGFVETSLPLTNIASGMYYVVVTSGEAAGPAWPIAVVR